METAQEIEELLRLSDPLALAEIYGEESDQVVSMTIEPVLPEPRLNLDTSLTTSPYVLFHSNNNGADAFGRLTKAISYKEGIF